MPPTALYRLLNEKNALLYIGIADNPEERFRSHAATKPWWCEVARNVVTWYEDRPTAVRIEREAVAAEKPHYNIHFLPIESRVQSAPVAKKPGAEKWSDYLSRISGIDEGTLQKDVAELTSTDTGTISRWIQGQNVPKVEGTIRVARAYGRPAGEALVAAGHLTPDDLGGTIEVRGALDDLADEVLLAEVDRRMKRGRIPDHEATASNSIDFS